MSVGEISQIITAMCAIGALLISLQNNFAIHVVSKQTNHMKDELVEEVRKASIAQGRKQELDRIK